VKLGRGVAFEEIIQIKLTGGWRMAAAGRKSSSIGEGAGYGFWEFKNQ